jgi:tRNA A37 threonylcarbamoyladenosine synthetase subunit TsaC/SUA5/YrdC
MDHAQFEMQVAAILAAGVAGQGGVKEPSAIVDLLVEIHTEITRRAVITKQSAGFVPKGR